MKTNTLIDFLLYLNDRGLINNYDFSYEDVANDYLNSLDSPQKTSEEWQKLYPETEIVDPDGRDRANFQYSWYEERITLEDYNKRLAMSTIKGKTK